MRMHSRERPTIYRFVHHGSHNIVSGLCSLITECLCGEYFQLCSNSSRPLFSVKISESVRLYQPYYASKNIMKTNYPVILGQKRSRCRSNRGIIDSPTPLFTPFCRFRYRSRGRICSPQYPRTSSTNDPFLKWFSYASRMMRIAMSTSPF